MLYGDRCHLYVNDKTYYFTKEASEYVIKYVINEDNVNKCRDIKNTLKSLFPELK